ncbi:MAG: TlpA family protein disulfide reductase [Acidimicrobiales bacterium]|nr:TlpA family protein disulfide reductase [Acidimicrobiales bacterium]
MGVQPGVGGTVEGGMDPSKPTPDDVAEPGAPAAPADGQRSARRRLDGRTIAVCVCVALIAALAAALVAGTVIDGDGDADADSPGTAMTLIDLEAVRTTHMETVDGKATTLEDQLGGKPMVVNLWASNCAPCIEELPLLERAAAVNTDLDFLGIDVLDRLDNAKAMADKAGVTYPWVQDRDGDFANAVRTTTMPSTFLFAPDGTILASKTDKAFKSQSQLQAWIDAAT